MADMNIAPAARQGLNPHNYNPISLASLDYGEFVVDRYIECEKSDDWNKVHAEGFMRVAPSDFPAYGRTFLKSAAFFVPYYQVLQNIDGFQAGQVADKGIPCIMPHVRADIVNSLLSHTDYATRVAKNVDPSALPDPDGNTPWEILHVVDEGGDIPAFEAWHLNYKGLRFYKWLKMLGFDYVTYRTGASYQAIMDAIPFVNALSILAYAKVWADYFCNIHLYQSSVVVQLLRAVKDGEDFLFGGSSYYARNTGYLYPVAVQRIFLDTLVPFKSSLYLDAWNSEMSPIGDVSNEKSLDNSIIGPHLPQNVGFTDYIALTSSEITAKQHLQNYLLGISQYGLNSLQSAFKFAKRNGLFGSEPARQAFARFGIKGDDFNALFARKLYEGTQKIDFSAVVSNSNTVVPGTEQGSFLGAYAGYADCPLNFTYNYKCSDYGIILHFNWLQIVPIQIHGLNPSVLRMHYRDWWKPEYDGKAIRAIPLMEVSASRIPASQAANSNEQTYGFIGLYDEYRKMRDNVLGDFVFGNAKKFFFGRDISKKRETFRTNIVPQSVAMQYFTRFGSDPELIDPFMYSQESGDRFYLQLIYDIEANREILSSADSFDLNGEGEVRVSTDSNPNA